MVLERDRRDDSGEPGRGRDDTDGVTRGDQCVHSVVVVRFVRRRGLSIGRTLPVAGCRRWRSAGGDRAAQGGDPGRAAESDEEACALGEMASARVEKEAPGAPQAVKDEAVIRYSGYLAQADFGSIASESAGPLSATYPTNHAAAFRYSGAMGLLSRGRCAGPG